MASKSKPNELSLTREYDAPVDAVWDAWVDPEQVALWWGPRGFTLTTHSKDLRPGGHWRYTMHGPDGVDYPNNTVYYEVEEHRKLVYDHGANEQQPPLFRVTVIFTPLGAERTRMEMTMALETAEAAAEIKKFIRKAGGDSTWDRLAEYLAKEQSGKEIFVIHRAFDAPLDTVFEMWTTPEHVAQWLPPTGATMEFLRADIRAGGGSFYSMTTSQGLTMYGRMHYLTIDPPRTLVYTQQFCDKDENISRHPMAPTWPETMLTTVRFTAEDTDRTRISVLWEPHGAVSPEELAAFISFRGSMTQGWTGSFDKFEAYLAERP